MVLGKKHLFQDCRKMIQLKIREKKFQENRFSFSAFDRTIFESYGIKWFRACRTGDLFTAKSLLDAHVRKTNESADTKAISSRNSSRSASAFTTSTRASIWPAPDRTSSWCRFSRVVVRTSMQELRCVHFFAYLLHFSTNPFRPATRCFTWLLSETTSTWRGCWSKTTVRRNPDWTRGIDIRRIEEISAKASLDCRIFAIVQVIEE